MGSIFKPSSTVVQAPSQSTTTYDIPAYFKEIQERTLRRAETESQKTFSNLSRTTCSTFISRRNASC
jgi:hypothetical protein